jgi:hypothetical protein
VPYGPQDRPPGGRPNFALGEQAIRVQAGDVLALPGRIERQVAAVSATEIIACGENAVVVTGASRGAARTGSTKRRGLG